MFNSLNIWAQFERYLLCYHAGLLELGIWDLLVPQIHTHWEYALVWRATLFNKLQILNKTASFSGQFSGQRANTPLYCYLPPSGICSVAYNNSHHIPHIHIMMETHGYWLYISSVVLAIHWHTIWSCLSHYNYKKSRRNCWNLFANNVKVKITSGPMSCPTTCKIVQIIFDFLLGLQLNAYELIWEMLSVVKSRNIAIACFPVTFELQVQKAVYERLKMTGTYFCGWSVRLLLETKGRTVFLEGKRWEKQLRGKGEWLRDVWIWRTKVDERSSYPWSASPSDR